MQVLIILLIKSITKFSWSEKTYLLGKKWIQTKKWPPNKLIDPLIKSHNNEICPCSINQLHLQNKAHFPASYVSLPESNISQPFIPPQKPTYTLPNFNVEMKISPWKRILLLETIMFRFHLKLWGCTPWKKCCLENPSYPFKMVPFLRGKKSKALIHSREILPPFLVQKKTMNFV